MAIPKLALIPASQGTSLYSVLPSNGVGDFTFTRAGSATRINSQGLIETVASGVSRLNYPLIDGVVNGCPSHLLEPQRLQLIQYSEDFSQGYWTKSGASVVSGFVSPKGDTSAFKLVEDTSTGIHRAFKTGLASGTSASNKFVYSIFAKKSSRNWILLKTVVNSQSLTVDVWFDLLNGSVGTSVNGIGTIESFNNDWYKCSILITTGAAATSLNSYTYIADADNSFSYQGDGTSGVYIWGAQLEQGSYPTSYIPNYGTALGVTRSAETANGAGDASTFNDSEGVLFAEISALADDGTDRYIAISDGTISNRVNIFFNTNNKLRGFVSGTSSIESSIDIKSSNKCAYKYKSGQNSFWVNGFKIDELTSTISLSSLNKINFDRGDGGADFYGNTKQLQYFDSALTDSELETLTSWVSFTDMANGQLYTIQ